MPHATQCRPVFRCYFVGLQAMRFHYLRQGLSVCLSVGNFTWNYWSDFHENLPEMYLWRRKIPLNFRSHPHLDPDPGILKDSSTLQDRAFFTIWLISWENWWNQSCGFGPGIPSKLWKSFGSKPDPLGGRLHSLVIIELARDVITNISNLIFCCWFFLSTK